MIRNWKRGIGISAVAAALVAGPAVAQLVNRLEGGATLGRRSVETGVTAAGSESTAALDADASLLPGGMEVLRNGPGTFAVGLDDGTCCDPRDVMEITMEDLTIDVREMTTGLDVEYRLYAPGTPHFGNARLAVHSGSPASRMLHSWWLDTSRGQNIRKSISVILLKRDGSPARTYNYHDCFPVRFTLADSTSDPVDVLVFAIGGLSMDAADTGDREALGSGLPGLYAGFWDPGTPPGVTALWRSWRGGELGIFPPRQFPGSQFHTTTPGHKYIDTLTLRGPMTSGRQALCTWINDTVNGKPWKRSMTIREILKDGAAGKSYNYLDCFPIRYVFPRLSVDGSEPVSEEVRVKALRVELR